jgi:hypothetical protein
MPVRRDVLRMLLAGCAAWGAPALAASSTEMDVYLDPN